MAEKKIIDLQVKVDKALSEIDKLNKKLEKTDKDVSKVNESTATLTSSLDNITGGAVTKFKNFTKALKSVSLGFKSIGTAITASGIGLLIVVLASITAAFRGSEEGQNKFAKLMGVIGAVVGNVVDVLADFGDFIINLFSGNSEAVKSLKSFGESIFNFIGLPIKNLIDPVKALGKSLGALFSGDISGAFDELKKGVKDVKENFDEAKESIVGATNAVKDFAKQNIEEAKAAAKVADQRAKADKIERDLIVDRAKAEREIANLRLKARDLNNTTAKERETALKRVLDISDDLIAREKQVAELRSEAQTAENTFARSTKENLTEEERLKARVIQLETARLNQQRQIQRELTAAENEQRAAREARAKELAQENRGKVKPIGAPLTSEEQQELLDKKSEQFEQILDLEKSQENALFESSLAGLQEFQNSKALLEAQQTEDEKAQSEARKRIAQLESDAKQHSLEQYASALSSISGVIGQETEAGKAIAIASSLINTYASISGQLKAFSGVPIPGYAIAQAIATGVVGFANVKKIASVKIPKSNGGSSSVGGSLPSAGGASAPSFNIVGQTGTNQLAQTIGQQQQEPLQAFVVASQVTTQQSFDNNIVETATLG